MNRCTLAYAHTHEHKYIVGLHYVHISIILVCTFKGLYIQTHGCMSSSVSVCVCVCTFVQKVTSQKCYKACFPPPRVYTQTDTHVNTYTHTHSEHSLGSQRESVLSKLYSEHAAARALLRVCSFSRSRALSLSPCHSVSLSLYSSLTHSHPLSWQWAHSTHTQCYSHTRTHTHTLAHATHTHKSGASQAGPWSTVRQRRLFNSIAFAFVVGTLSVCVFNQASGARTSSFPHWYQQKHITAIKLRLWRRLFIFY